jgi:multiple sugar transport system permease protein
MSESVTKGTARRHWRLLLVPALCVLAVIEFYPLMYGLYLSLTGANEGATLANYSTLLSDGDFWSSVAVSLEISVLGTLLEFCLGLALAFLVLQAARGRQFLEAVFLAPLAMAPIAVGIAWAPSTVWDDFQTFIHFILKLPYFNELSPLFYIPVIALSEAWEWAPLVMLVCLGIADSTSKEVYDAATLNGASSWQVFRDVTIPSVLRSPVMRFVIVLQFIQAMWVFEIPLAWSNWLGYSTAVGSPADTVSLFLYKLLFLPNLGDPVHLVSAMALVLLVITLVGTTILVRLLRRIGAGGASSVDVKLPERAARPRTTQGRLGRKVLLYIAFTVATLYSIFPPVAMACDAAGANIAALIAIIGGAPVAPGAFFFTPFFYQNALSSAAFPSRALSSLIISGISVGVALLVGVPVSYALARIETNGKRAVTFVFVALKTISPFAVVLPLYLAFRQAGLWDTFPGAALAELVVVLTVVVWMVKGFFADIPRQMYDSASVYASSEMQVFRRVALPLVAGGIAVTAVFGFVLIWNEFLVSAIFTGPDTKTVAVGIWTGLQTGGNGKPQFIDLEAAAIVAYLPALAVMLSIKRYLARGFTLATAR